VVGDVLCLSGQIGANAQGTLVEGVEDQTRQTLANISEVLNLAGANLDDVFKCTVMLADMADWSAFNRIYLEHFHPDRLPTRSSFGVSGLAAGALVEIECWAMLRRPGDGV
jgi:reactive intermediate/imine deaminase